MNFSSLFTPTSIAVIGASTREGSVSNDVIRNLQRQGYKGHIYPVNPKSQPILGLTTYPSITAIGKPVDLAIVIIPAQSVPAVMQEIAQAGTHAVIVISAGFKEQGEQGRALEREIVEIAREHDITLVGPNCLGILNPRHDLNISFAKAPARVGNVAFVSQSGALCSSVLDYAEEYGIGFSKFVSVGNKASLDEVDFVSELARDPDTKVILMYIEDAHDSARFISRVRAVTQGQDAKPVIAIKAGRTTEGASASASHTGALAGSHEAFDALFKQAGVIRVDSVEELFVFAAAFAHNAPLRGDRIAVVSNAGGPGVLVTDELVASGLKIAHFTPETSAILQRSLPSAANIHNPVDVLGDAKSDRYKTALEAVVADTQVDGVIVVLTPQSMTDVAEVAITLSNIKAATTKPIIASFMGSQSTREAEGILQRHNVANILFPESAARAMAQLYRFHNSTSPSRSYEVPARHSDVDSHSVQGIFDRMSAMSQRYIPEAVALEVMRAYRLPTLRSTIVRSPDDLTAATPSITYPVAMKIISRDIVHKTEVGGVRLGVHPDKLQENYTSLLHDVKLKAPHAALEGVLLAEMAPSGGVEYVIGVKDDPSLGHLLMFGLGGIYVETLRDVSFRLAPLTVHDARSLISEIKSAKLIRGVRGLLPLDEDALTDSLLRISQLVTDHPQIKELDINPILVLPKGQGVRVLDARMVIG